MVGALLPQIWHDMYGVPGKGFQPFPKAPLLATPPKPPRELMWQLPHELKGEVQFAQVAFDRACDGFSLDMIDFGDFGKNACKVGCITRSVTVVLLFV